MELDRGEALRYLGYRGHEPDERVRELLDECAAELSELSTLRYAYRRFDDLEFIDDGAEAGREVGAKDGAKDDAKGDVKADGKIGVRIGGIDFVSRELAAHLAGCDAAVILCATLGAEADRLRQRYEKIDMTRAVVADAAQSAYIEQLCDKACEEIAERFSRRCTDRFSPGYGDLSLDCQGAVLRLSDAYRRIGLTLSDTNMLTPQKSVTAFVGLKIESKPSEQNLSEQNPLERRPNRSAAEQPRCRGGRKKSSCERCPMHDSCQFSTLN